MSHPLNNALQRQFDPPKWRVTRFRNPHVNLDGRRFVVTLSLNPLCLGKIEMPDRSTLLAGDDACANNADPAVVTPSIALVDRTRCPFAAMVDLCCWMTLTITSNTVLLSCVQDLKMWQNVSSSICSARFLKCQGIPHVGHGVPDVADRPHFIHVLDEIGNGLIAVASGACIIMLMSDLTHTYL